MARGAKRAAKRRTARHDPLPQRRELWHGVLYGDFGEGKSDALAHVLPKPLVALMFDARGKDTPYLRLRLGGGKYGVPQPMKRDKRDVLYREVLHPDDGRLLIRLEYYAAPDISKPQVFGSFLDRVSLLEKQLHLYRSACLDSSSFGTLLARKFMQYDVDPDAEDPRKLYGGATDFMEEILLCQLPQLSMNVGVAAHISRERIKVGDQRLGMPLMPGRVQETIGMAWPEIYRVYVEPGQKRTAGVPRRLQTQPDGRWCAATQIDAPNGCRVSWKQIWKREDRRLARMRRVA